MERIYSPQKWVNCPMEMPLTVHMHVPKVNIGRIKISGVLEAKEEVLGDIEFVMEASRCTLDMKTCEKYSTLNVGEMCVKFEWKNIYYSGIFDNFKPHLKCPFQPGNYTLEESVLDLSPFTMFPLDGYVYIAAFRLVSGKARKSKKVIMCINTETKIFKTSNKKLLQLDQLWGCCLKNFLSLWMI